MTPRKPYRSPFYRPDFAEENRSTGLRDTKAEPLFAEPDRTVRPAPPASRLPARTIPQHPTGYSESDLALFGRLTNYNDRSHTADAPRVGPEPRAQPEARRSTAQLRPAPSGSHSSGDMALFQTLQAPFSNVRQEGTDARRTTPSIDPTLATHGYSQQDLEAFEKLTRFGRSHMGEGKS